MLELLFRLFRQVKINGSQQAVGSCHLHSHWLAQAEGAPRFDNNAGKANK